MKRETLSVASQARITQAKSARTEDCNQNIWARVVTCLFLLSTICCNQEIDNAPAQSEVAPTINLENGILNLSELLAEGDTIWLSANLSWHSSEHYETNVITRSNGSVQLTSFNTAEYVKKEEEEMGPIDYQLNPTDSLSFESLFRDVMKMEVDSSRNSNRYLFFVKFKNDSLSIGNRGSLGSKKVSDIISDYESVKHKLFPEALIYEPLTYPELYDILKDP